MDISHSSRISGKLFILIGHSFPKLHTLNLKDCGLNSEDLCSLAKANCRNRLPELKHLDLSDNPGIVCHLRCFFSCAQNWRNLNLLAVESPKVTYNQDLVTAVRAGALQNVQTLITKTESDMNLSAITSVKWLSLQRLVLSCCSAYTSVRCVTILQSILEAKEKEMLPNLDELFIIREILLIDPSTPADFGSSFSGSSFSTHNPLYKDYFADTCHKLMDRFSQFVMDEYFEFVFNRLYEKLESKSQLLCPEDSESVIIAVSEEIFRELISRVRIKFVFHEFFVKDLEDFFGYSSRRPGNENAIISHVRTFYDEMRNLTTEEIDELKIVSEALKPIEPSSEDVSFLRLSAKFLQLRRMKYELAKRGIRFHIFAPTSSFRMGEIAVNIK